MSYINILGKKYEILDTKEYITLADSFLLNKIGSGHGEAKLYVGNESQELFSFWEDFNSKCFIIKIFPVFPHAIYFCVEIHLLSV